MRSAILLFSLAGLIFLLAPAEKTSAAPYSCRLYDGGCVKSIDAPNLDAAKDLCKGACGGVECFVYSGSCPVQEWGCYRNGVCSNIKASDQNQAKTLCEFACSGSCYVLQGTCPLLDYSCFKDDVCAPIKAINATAAEENCRSYCGGDAKSCRSEAGTCPIPAPLTPAAPDKPGPLPGASVGALKGMALSTLNKARISGPADLINRAIRILLAFIGSISLVLYIYAGILLMTARGNSEQSGKAKNIMVWTTLGVVIMLASYMLASFIFRALGV